MEISSGPFLNQDDYNYFYTFFQGMEGNSGNEDFNNNNNNGDGKKRRRIDSDSNIKEILSAVMLWDEEEKFENDELGFALNQEKSSFDANYKQRTQAMEEHYESNVQGHFGDLEDLESSRVKRARNSASTVMASIAAKTENSEDPSSQSSNVKEISGGHRRLWVKDRSKAWWDRCNHPDFPESDFRKAFRMSKATFDMICDELDSVVTKKDTMLRTAIPVRQRVAVCIWRLATGEPLRLVSKRFGLGISTCHKLVLEVCSAIKSVLMPKFLQWPDENRVQTIKNEYELISGIPNLGGSMYTTHVPIVAPKMSVAAYFNKRHTERNQKTSYSITVQGVVDPRGIFTDVCIGWPGSMPDDQVLEKSALYQRASRGLLKDVWIVGNSSYPLMDWVLVPYSHQNLTWTQHEFNQKIGEIQKVAKDAVMRLKGRWTCLQKRTEVKLQDLPVVLGACCVLHNICEMRNEEMDPELIFDLFDDEMIPESSIRSANAVLARDHIAHDLLHHGLGGTSFF
ncbi:Harbinger transposase-derived nuclease domain [Dillenia turbinata]|uniref:Harbinger transposase-derived nuclease domain n=1 Tax=Dillenia turbinata TaxID=194707 RepID=A0AAN8W7G4_9MAGN